MDNLSVKPTPVLRSHYIPAFVQNLGEMRGARSENHGWFKPDIARVNRQLCAAHVKYGWRDQYFHPWTDILHISSYYVSAWQKF